MPSHFSLKAMNVVSHSAPVATQCVHAAGIGLAIKLRKEDRVVLTALGEGSTAQGEWYEAVNWAAVQQLPVIFIVENNMYAISEPMEKQMAVKSAAEKACGPGDEDAFHRGTSTSGRLPTSAASSSGVGKIIRPSASRVSRNCRCT